MAKTSKPAEPRPGNTFFDLSLRGALPDLLRELAAQIDAGTVTAETFEWALNVDQVVFTARLEFKR